MQFTHYGGMMMGLTTQIFGLLPLAFAVLAVMVYVVVEVLYVTHSQFGLFGSVYLPL